MKQEFKFTELDTVAQHKAVCVYLTQFLKPITKDNINMGYEILSKNEEYFDSEGNYLRKV